MIASGDLTHRGRPEQHDAAAAFLRSLGAPLLVVPGNHDIPYTFPAASRGRGASSSGTGGRPSPCYASAELHVVGLNSVRPWRHQSGRVRDGAARACRGAAAAARAGSAARRRPAPPADRRAVALAQEAASRGAATYSAARRRGRRADRRRAHPPGRDLRAARVRGGARRRARRRRLDRARASASRARTGAARRAAFTSTRSTSATSGATYMWRDGGWALTAERRLRARTRSAEPRRRPAAARPGVGRRAREAAVLDEAPVGIEQEHRAEEREEEAARPPSSTRAMIPPTSEPARPSATVAYQASGRGPAAPSVRARRRRSPDERRMMNVSMAAGLPCVPRC